jgi:hypothetical protein
MRKLQAKGPAAALKAGSNIHHSRKGVLVGCNRIIQKSGAPPLRQISCDGIRKASPPAKKRAPRIDGAVALGPGGFKTTSRAWGAPSCFVYRNIYWPADDQ